jgi:phosphatidylinositol glycan class W
MRHVLTSSVRTKKELFRSPVRPLLFLQTEIYSGVTGYVAIHLLGLSTGTLLLPPSPSHFRRRQQAFIENSHRKSVPKFNPSDERPGIPVQRQNDKTAAELFSYAAVWWSMMGLIRILGVGNDVSRRMVFSRFSSPKSCLNLTVFLYRLT